MTKYDWLLLGHLLAAFLFLCGAIVAGVLHWLAMRRTRPSEVALLLQLVRTTVPLVGIGSLAALGFGLWLVDEAGYGFGDGWIVAAIVLWSCPAPLPDRRASDSAMLASSPSASPPRATSRAPNCTAPSPTGPRSCSTT